MLRRLILIVCLAIILAGCANDLFMAPEKLPEGYLENDTSALIGCPAEEIKISNYNRGVYITSSPTWRAECRHKNYYCSWPTSGGPRCTEDLKPN